MRLRVVDPLVLAVVVLDVVRRFVAVRLEFVNNATEPLLLRLPEHEALAAYKPRLGLGDALILHIPASASTTTAATTTTATHGKLAAATRCLA